MHKSGAPGGGGPHRLREVHAGSGFVPRRRRVVGRRGLFFLFGTSSDSSGAKEGFVGYASGGVEPVPTRPVQKKVLLDMFREVWNQFRLVRCKRRFCWICFGWLGTSSDSSGAKEGFVGYVSGGLEPVPTRPVQKKVLFGRIFFYNWGGDPYLLIGGRDWWLGVPSKPQVFSFRPGIDPKTGPVVLLGAGGKQPSRAARLGSSHGPAPVLQVQQFRDQCEPLAF